MRFIIYGAGGVGSVIGAELQKAGVDVALIARGAHLDAIRDRGLRYETPFEDSLMALHAVGHPRELDFRDDDVVMLTMKSHHTRSALEDLRASGGHALPIICCQNGVANEREALRRFADVYAMLVYLPAQFIEPGRIQCHARLKSGVLDLGVFPQGTGARAAEIARHLESANFSARPDPEVMRLKYAKLLTNLANGLEAVADGDADDLVETMRVEGRRCLDAAGIAFASEAEVKARREGVFAFGEIDGIARAGGSSRQSLMRGTGDIETDYLNGEIVQLGRLQGVPTPTNAVIQHLSADLARRRQPPGSIPIERLRDMIATEAKREG
jgi:2-dehydropantoate 2-reductase